MATAYEFDYNVNRPQKALRFERPTHKSVTTTVTLTYDDAQKIHFDATAGAFTITLPTPYEGLEYHFCEVAGLATAVTLDSGSGNTINGVRMLTMNAAFRVRKLRAISATAWVVDGAVN